MKKNLLILLTIFLLPMLLIAQPIPPQNPPPKKKPHAFSNDDPGTVRRFIVIRPRFSGHTATNKGGAGFSLEGNCEGNSDTGWGANVELTSVAGDLEASCSASVSSSPSGTSGSCEVEVSGNGGGIGFQFDSDGTASASGEIQFCSENNGQITCQSDSDGNLSGNVSGTIPCGGLNISGLFGASSSPSGPIDWECEGSVGNQNGNFILGIESNDGQVTASCLLRWSR